MSQVEITLTSPTANAADEESSRYSLMNVEVFPQPKDRVLAVSTNGRVAAIVDLPGKCDRPRLVPRSVIPLAKSHMPKRDYPVVKLQDGQWISNGKKVLTAPQAEAGRFPRMSDIIPALPSEENTLVVSFDAAELLKLADSIRSQVEGAGASEPKEEGCQPIVTLMINKSRAEQNSAICVVGSEGIGVLMPCCNNPRQMSYSASVAEKRKRYTELAKRLYEAETKYFSGRGKQHYPDEQPVAEAAKA